MALAHFYKLLDSLAVSNYGRVEEFLSQILLQPLLLLLLLLLEQKSSHRPECARLLVDLHRKSCLGCQPQAWLHLCLDLSWNHLDANDSRMSLARRQAGNGGRAGTGSQARAKRHQEPHKDAAGAETTSGGGGKSFGSP